MKSNGHYFRLITPAQHRVLREALEKPWLEHYPHFMHVEDWRRLYSWRPRFHHRCRHVLTRRRNIHSYVLFADGQPIGAVVAIEYPTHVKIEELFLHKNFRGLGFGRRMLRMARRTRVPKPMRLDVMLKNTPAIAFYEAVRGTRGRIHHWHKWGPILEFRWKSGDVS